VTDLTSAHDTYLTALLARDSARARAAVEAAVAAGTPPEAIDLEVIGPALRAVGDLWERGEATVADEHYASGISEGLMARLATAMREPPAGGRLAVVTCAPGEHHALAARMLADLLEAEAWEAIALGPSMPARDLIGLVEAEQPDVVAVSITMRDSIEPTIELMAALSVVEPRPFLVAGGQALADGADVGADAIESDVGALVGLLTERFPPLPD
jgi:methanogenic corrinoid protein MtbC1